MISYQEALAAGMAIAEKSASVFFHKNSTDYNRLGFEAKDIEGYLYEHVLVKKYLPNIEKNPGFYENINKFKASFYVACRNAMLVHHQTHIKCKKRGDILRSTVVELDAPLLSGQGSSTLGVSGSTDYLASIKEMVDSCVAASGLPNWEVARPLTLLAYGVVNGKCASKSDLRKSLADLGKAQFERLWDAICMHMSSFRENTFGSAMFTAYQT